MYTSVLLLIIKWLLLFQLKTKRDKSSILYYFIGTLIVQHTYPTFNIVVHKFNKFIKWYKVYTINNNNVKYKFKTIIKCSFI